MARKEEPKIQPNNDLEKKIIEAFEVFDHSGKQVVDVREIGTILRSLGCCPTEAEIQEVILATENKEATGNVPLANFLPFMCKVMLEHRYYPASAEMLLAAFRYFDTEGKGYLTKERFSQLMLEEGGIRRNDADGARPGDRHHYIRVLHQSTDGECFLLF
ncbi:unnamed protein product [Chilo suppressalis]|uniref:EF-hand domain-containing protein n=1 Tax=Chilo suppressalis TaxID=168631 RepID=A0ABN8L5F5_CHISP|nr:unnamed protein product [Chilo suppressalis]